MTTLHEGARTCGAVRRWRSQESRRTQCAATCAAGMARVLQAWHVCCRYGTCAAGMARVLQVWHVLLPDRLEVKHHVDERTRAAPWRVACLLCEVGERGVHRPTRRCEGPHHKVRRAQAGERVIVGRVPANVHARAEHPHGMGRSVPDASRELEGGVRDRRRRRRRGRRHWWARRRQRPRRRWRKRWRCEARSAVRTVGGVVTEAVGTVDAAIVACAIRRVRARIIA